jgi:hypothetical protein
MNDRLCGIALVAHPTLIPSPSRGREAQVAMLVFIVSLPLVGRDQGWG